MSLIPLIILTLVFLALYAVFFKLAVSLFKRTRLKWSHSFFRPAIALHSTRRKGGYIPGINLYLSL